MIANVIIIFYFCILGLYASIENIKVASEATLCYIDIDKCKVQLPEEMPAFPNLDGLTDELNCTMDKYGVHIPNTDNCRNTQVYIKTIPEYITFRRKDRKLDTLFTAVFLAIIVIF